MRLLNVLNETNVRLNEKMATLPRLSVSQGKGVVPSDSLNVNSMQASNFEKYKIVQPGHLVVNRFNAYKGALGRAPFRGIVSPDYFTGEINRSRSDDRYIEYFLRAKPTANLIERDMSGMGSGDPNSSAFSRFDVRSFLNLTIPVSDLQRQQRIADYLDRETAEIDAAVAALDRYVELLEQRRLFTVDEVLNSNEAVTSEWTEMSLKFVIRERFVGDWGGEPGTAEVDSVCVRVADFDRPTNTVNDQVPTTRSYSRAKYEAKRLQHHDILVERSGGGDKTPVGSAMLYTGGDEALCANFIEVVRLKEDQLPEYWVHILRREYMGRNTMRFVKQTTGIQNLDPQSFYDQKFPVPSLNEQHSLAEELRQRTSEIDSLIADSTRLRDLLLKRRSVLITEVVTGRKQV